MDDSFDELEVPDNWLPSKRKLDDESVESHTKRPKLCVPSSPSKHSPSLGISSATETSSELEISNEAETLEDVSINEPHLFSDDESNFNVIDTNNYQINGHGIAAYKNQETENGNCSELKCFAKDIDSNVCQAFDFSHGNENRLVTEDNEAAPIGLENSESFANNKDSKDHEEHHPKDSHEETLTPGDKKIVKCDDSNCLEQEIIPNSPHHSNEPPYSEEKTRLKNHLSVVRDAKIIADIVPNKEVNEIYNMLLEHRDKSNRLDIVTFELTEVKDDLQPDVDIFEDVKRVSRVVPSVSVNEIYTMLEQLPSSSNRVQDVITNIMLSDVLTREPSAYAHLHPAEKNAGILDNAFLENDPLLKDMRTIAKMFPEKDRNEIYALLEANFRAENRLEKVINEILHVEALNTEGTQPSQHVGAGYTMENTISSDVDGDTLVYDMERMRNVFPDCDPNYLYEKLHSMKDTPNRTDVLAAEMFEKRNYPKLKDLLDKDNEKEKKNKAKHMTMTVSEFLQKFSDPLKTFTDGKKELSRIYKQHSEILLQNEFPMFRSGYLTKVLRKHNGHLYLAYQEVSARLLKTPLAKRTKMVIFLKKPRSEKLEMPDTVDEYFYHELWFIYNELSVLDYIKQKDKQRKQDIETARITGQLHECCCCYDDECLLEDLASCADGHLFCKTCVVRSTEAAFGEMKTKFPCLTGECDQDIPLSFLQNIIPANLFSKIVRRLQEEEVQQANIPDLVTCPFCPFAAIMPNPLDTVFKCLNPDCLKESCRLCQEPNHIPLRCNEVEKKAETDMRVYIENKISEAVMRKCHKCGKRFVKDTGCNKMTCVCGATSCYVCKATDIDYDHFNNNNNCNNMNPDDVHQRDMEDAALKAKTQYILDHPEAADVELKSDVKNMINDFKSANGKRKKVVEQPSPVQLNKTLYRNKRRRRHTNPH